ncbi:MAG: putative rane protein [Deltaproteobacteria bacterium]|nr:putative rane protein [Deltaproteobacteria bacterium]
MMKPGKKKVKIIVIALISIVIVAVVILALVQGVGRKKENVIKIMPDEADIRIQDFVFTEVGQNKIRWDVKAKSGQYQKKKNLALFDQVRIQATTEEGKIYVMTGKTGKMLTDKKDLEITGDVVITSDSGDRFTTDYLRYVNDQRKIYTDAPVVMENRKMRIQAVGLNIFIDKGELILLSGVRAKLN